MKLYFPRTPRILMRFFSKYTWRFNTDKKEIFLTFDDGPTPEITEFVLSELKQYSAKATFFCIGKNIVNHPEIFKKVLKEGHSIGNHTHNHLKGWQSNKNDYLRNFEEAKSTIQQFSNSTNQPKLFRPPYGKIKKSQAKEILNKDYKIIMWDVLSADFDTTISNEECLKNVLRNTRNGSIIVFHDSVKASEKVRYVLPKILKEFSEKGYEFSKIE